MSLLEVAGMAAELSININSLHGVIRGIGFHQHQLQATTRMEVKFMNKKTKSLLLIIGAVALAAVFIAFGAGKFIDPAKWEAKFAAWGLPIWFVAVSGALEIAGAIGLLVPVLRGLAGVGLALFMIGAVGTHVVHAEIVMIFVAGAILVASAALGWVRWPETAEFLRQKFGGPTTDAA